MTSVAKARASCPGGACTLSSLPCNGEYKGIATPLQSFSSFPNNRGWSGKDAPEKARGKLKWEETCAPPGPGREGIGRCCGRTDWKSVLPKGRTNSVRGLSP